MTQENHPQKTLRDEFAIAAMQAHIAASFPALAAAMQNDTDSINEVIAMAAYETADAMLAARKATGESPTA